MHWNTSKAHYIQRYVWITYSILCYAQANDRPNDQTHEEKKGRFDTRSVLQRQMSSSSTNKRIKKRIIAHNSILRAQSLAKLLLLPLPLLLGQRSNVNVFFGSCFILCALFPANKKNRCSAFDANFISHAISFVNNHSHVIRAEQWFRFWFLPRVKW